MVTPSRSTSGAVTETAAEGDSAREPATAPPSATFTVSCFGHRAGRPPAGTDGRRFIADVRRLPRYTGHSAEVRPSSFLTHAGVQREMSLITENALAVAQRVGGGPVKIMIGCDHGRHRSVTVARAVVRRLAAGGFAVSGPGSPASGPAARQESADSDLSDADTDQEVVQEPRCRDRKRAQIRSRAVRLHDDALCKN